MNTSRLFERIRQEVDPDGTLERARKSLRKEFEHTLALVVIDSCEFSRTT